MRFQDQIVVVTGASTGIGRATAAAFLREGAYVYAVSRNLQRGKDAEAFLKNISPRCEFVACDVGDSKQVQSLFAYLNEKCGYIDVLYNNAGVSFPGGLEDVREEDWDEIMRVNLKGAFLCSRYSLPLLRKGQGKVIINTVSELGFVATTGCLPYLCSKGGLLQLTRGMALELAAEGIRVNAVCPAGTESEMFRRDMSRGAGYEANVAKLAAAYPLGRIGKPEDIAPAVLYLASQDSSFMTGQYILLDGGFTIR